MTLVRMVPIIVLLILLSSCAMGQPAIPLATPTNTVALPSSTLVAVDPTATQTLTATPTATSTSTPTSTSTSIRTSTPTLPSTATATETATEIPSPTATLPPFLLTDQTPLLPNGKGGLVVVNHVGAELTYNIGGKLYKIPANGRMLIFLPPGRYTFSASALGFAGKSGSIDVLEGYYCPQDWG